MNFLKKNDVYFHFVFRVLVGFTFFMHGAQKLFGWFGGKAVADVTSMFGAAGVIETVGGLAIVLGLFVRPVALVTAVEMAFAWFVAHAPKGWNPLQNGGEAALLFFAAFVMLVAHGAGKWGLERAIWRKEHI